MSTLIMYLFAIILFLPCYVFTKHILHKIKNLPPTPILSLPIIGHLYLFTNNSSSLTRTLTNLSKPYGPVIYLWFGSRPVLIVSSPSAANECLLINDVAFAGRPQSLVGKVLGYDNSALLVAPYGDQWRNLRRIVASKVLSRSQLQLVSAIRSDELKSGLIKLYKQCSSLQDCYVEVDMRTIFSELMYNVMMRMIVGKFFYVWKNEGVFRNVVEEIFEIAELPNIGDFVPILGKLGCGMNTQKTILRVHEKSDKLLQGLIEEVRSMVLCEDNTERKNNEGLVQVLLSVQKTNPEEYTDEMIKGLIIVLIIAGVDTTSTTMEWALSLLLNNPTTILKAQAEIDEHIGHERLVEESDLGKLVYLHGIVNETLRMFPAAPLLVPHESTSDCIVHGYHVPRGTMLLVNVWAIHNDPDVWDEPRVFKPERFGGVKGNRVEFKLMPFGSGRRVCPGETLAMRMIELMVGSILQCFELDRVGEELVDMEERSRLTMPKSKPLSAKLKPRFPISKLLNQLVTE